MKLFRIGLLVPLVLLLAAAFAAACGDDDDGDASPAATTPADDGEAVLVEADDFLFDPAEFTVVAGEEVIIEVANAGSVAHTLTVYSDEGYTEPVDGADTGSTSAGGDGEFTATFTEAGTLFFRCEFHPSQMQGEITVQ